MKLEARHFRKLNFMVRSNINFLSGTMCPARKLDEELESLYWAMDYYKSVGVDQVVLQPKWMGSRAQSYIFKEPEDNFIVTRRGSVRQIPQLDSRLQSLFIKLESRYPGLRFAIIDGEILPWSYFAKDLISESFSGISEMMRREIDLVVSKNIFEEFEKLEYRFGGLDITAIDKSTFIAKQGHHNWRALQAYSVLAEEFIPFENQLHNLELYDQQVSLYGGDGDLEFKSFMILKLGFEDGSEQLGYEVYNNYSGFSDDEPIGVYSTDGEYHPAVEFFNSLTGGGYEGVVVKPLEIRMDVIPYFKVRNEEYLRLVYGPNYTEPTFYGKLLQRKSIRYKMKLSMGDWLRGWEMLKIPYNEVRGSERIFRLFTEHLFSESHAETVDPRL